MSRAFSAAMNAGSTEPTDPSVSSDPTGTGEGRIGDGTLRVNGLRISYPGHPPTPAVAGVDLQVAPGEVLGLVGESGCGKSTLARAVCGLLAPSGGSVVFDGEPVLPLGLRRRPARLTRIQMVFQDPYASLHPRRRIGAQIAEGTRAAAARDAAAGRPAAARPSPQDWLVKVGLDPNVVHRYPHEFSGGQRQRVAIARALAAEPTLLIGDEPISSLDASTQSVVAALLRDLAVDAGAGLLFISHDLSVVRLVADRLAVMYRGHVVETGPTAQVWARPRHAYTRALLAAIPAPDGAGRLPQAPPDGATYSTTPVVRTDQ